MKDYDQIATNKDSLEYSGNVTIKLYDGERLLRTSKHHNTGCAKLFNFIADCLTGNFSGAKSSRPCKVVLFKHDTDYPIGSDKDDTVTFQPNSFNEKSRVSTKVFYDTTIYPGINEDGSSSITYHFRIPFLCLVGGERVYKVGLYPNTISDLRTDICAYYLLAKDEENKQDFEIPTEGGNFTVIIDWTLTIKNK